MAIVENKTKNGEKIKPPFDLCSTLILMHLHIKAMTSHFQPKTFGNGSPKKTSANRQVSKNRSTSFTKCSLRSSLIMEIVVKSESGFKLTQVVT